MGQSDVKDPDAVEERNQPFSADDVLGAMAASQEKAAADAAEKAKQAEEEQKALHQAFLEREIHPDVWKRIRARVQTAIKNGENEVKVLEFPSDWCTDKGRAINNGLENWPETLTGFAKRAYDFWESEMKPRGFTTHAAITSYPDGMPGDVALFLGWTKSGEGES